MQELERSVREASLVVKLIICSNSGILEHAGTRISPCRIYIGPKKGQSRTIFEYLNVSRILSKNLDYIQGILILMSLKRTFDGLPD